MKDYDFTRCPCQICTGGTGEPQTATHQERPTPWAVFCHFGHRTVYLTHHEYVKQMTSPDNLWMCPVCREFASWDDDNGEQAQAIEMILKETGG